MNDAPCFDCWYHEMLGDNVALSFRVEKTLFSKRSGHQRVDILRTAGHGKMLLNDGTVMLAERDEFIYHEMIAHVPLFVHPAPEKVLIVGGGDGGTAREALRHATVKRVTMVEIDEMVVEACRKHIPSVSCALDDPRLELVVGDGVEYVAGADEKFQVVIVDSSDPVGPAVELFNRNFYENASRVLARDGILVVQAESPFYDVKTQVSIFGNQRDFFPKLHMYTYSNLTYPGGLWSFGFASKKHCPLKDFREQAVLDSGLAFNYYNPEIHRAAFALPSFVRKNLSGVLDFFD